MSKITLVTEIPGPKSQAVLARRDAAVTQALFRSTEVVVDRAEGIYVHDVDGNTLMDFAGGIGMLAVGHCPTSVVDAIREQSEKLLHVCSLVATYEPYVELCEMLIDLMPGDFDKKAYLSNSGAEAVETAVKFARYKTGRPAIVCFEGAYHGRTLMTMSLTSKYSLFKKGFGPFASDIVRLPAPNVYRKPDGLSEEEYVEWCCQQLKAAMVSQVDPSEVAAILIEPVQGEAGFVPMPKRFLETIRQLCDEHGVVMIADEIQCGCGRTGRFLAAEHSGVVPDLVTLGKSLGAGLPISAVVGRADVMDCVHLGGVGGTYGGSPVACVAAIEALKIIREPAFLERVTRIGKIMQEEMDTWHERSPLVGDTRGLGAMRLVEFVLDRATKEPAPNQTLDVVKHAARRGLITIRAGLYSNGVRLMPPLTLSDDELREGLGILGDAIEALPHPS